MNALMYTERITKIFKSGILREKVTIAVNNVNISIGVNEILALVGESGSGKSTLAKIMVRLLKPTSGKVVFSGVEVWKELKRKDQLKWFYRNVNIIPQDPYSAFNPYHKVDTVLKRALKLVDIEPESSEGKKEVTEALRFAGLNPDEILGRYPHQLSGGQKQRLLIARLYIIKPKIIIADEPVSMVDPSLRSYILKLLLDLIGTTNSSMLFITHDIGLAYNVSVRIAVMYRGQIVEEGSTEEVVSSPKHPYTKLLVECAPRVRG